MLGFMYHTYKPFVQPKPEAVGHAEGSIIRSHIPSRVPETPDTYRS